MTSPVPVPVTSASPDTGTLRAPSRARAGAGDAAWDREYGRDVWRLRELGITDRGIARITFTGIPQPWLKNLAKRWARWQLTTGRSSGTAARAAAALSRFSQFLAAQPPSASTAGTTPCRPAPCSTPRTTPRQPAGCPGHWPGT